MAKIKILIVEEVPPAVAMDLIMDVAHGNVIFNDAPGRPTQALTSEQTARLLNETEGRLVDQDERLRLQAHALKEQEVLIADLKEALAQFSPDKVKAVRPKKKAKKAA